MKFFFLLMLMLGLVSCSGSKSTSDVEESEAGIELTDSEEFTDEDASDDVVGDNTSDEMEDLSEEVTSDDSSEMADAGKPTINEVGGIGEYTVQKNETLMMISFKIYGDYGNWRKISALNNGVEIVKEGMTIKYEKPLEMFSWAPEGNKYLIKRGDTLGLISDTTYGTSKLWKEIWMNNKPLIKDPNRIFAGFTIFTPIIEGRDVANNNTSDL